MYALKHYVKSLLLWELLKGMQLTGRHLFNKKITVQYPEEKTPQSHRFRGLHALRRYPNGEVSIAGSVKNPARWIPLSKPASTSITSSSVARTS